MLLVYDLDVFSFCYKVSLMEVVTPAEMMEGVSWFGIEAGLKFVRLLFWFGLALSSKPQ